MKHLVLVVGAAGQLGDAIVQQLSVEHEVIARTRDELDISVAEAVVATLTSVGPDVVINCAAYTNVDGAEDDPVSAIAVNALAVRTLARTAGDLDATFVHFSTDFVFDGKASRPYTEDDPPNPRSAYSMSKLLGEWFAADCPRHYVLRVESLFGGRHARSSVDKILAGVLADDEVRAFSDRTVSPSYVEDVVLATSKLIERGSPPGLYHCVNSGWTTWSLLAREVARLAGRPEARIVDVPVAEVTLRAQRPKFAALSNARLLDQGITMPGWEDALRRYVESRSPGVKGA
jgi:dTDP-4-dehydrorhamnose reductase